MIIKNVNKKNLFSCKGDLAKQLQTEYNIPLLTFQDENFYFVLTDKLKEVLTQLKIEYQEV